MSGRKLRLLDLFSGAGGAAVGYARAGFEVVGVDHVDQPNYPYEFIQADALAVLRDGCWEHSPEWLYVSDFDAIHASPPCQAFTQMSARYRGKGGPTDDHPNLIPETRRLLEETGLPYVIENVVGAKDHMRTDLMLHGGMFGLGVHRPRRFELNWPALNSLSPPVKGPIGVYGTKPDGRTTYRYRNAGNYVVGQPGSAKKSLIRAAKSIEEAREAMGIDWMTWDEIREAIPPAYTEFIGHQLAQYIRTTPDRGLGASPSPNTNKENT